MKAATKKIPSEEIARKNVILKIYLGYIWRFYDK